MRYLNKIFYFFFEPLKACTIHLLKGRLIECSCGLYRFRRAVKKTIIAGLMVKIACAALFIFPQKL